jgi:hypothetical protein
MNKKLLKATEQPRSGKSWTATARLKLIRDLNAVHSAGHARYKYPTKIQNIADALIAEGYLSLDSQAKALGVCRSTAWTIVRTKHKLDRLSFKTTDSMLANPKLPPSVRLVVQKYMAERSDALAVRAERLNRREQQSNKLGAVGN